MSIKRDLTSGVFYTAVAKYSGILISLVITSVLARLLTPEDFGVVAVATVIITFFNILGDIGIGPAVIQRNNLSKTDVEYIYSFTIYLGVALSLLFVLLAYPISKVYSDVTLIGVCQWLSLSIFFTCLNIVPLNLRYKNKEFRRIALVTLGVQVVTGALSIWYAYLGGGVYALVLSSILSTGLLALIYNCLAKLRFRFRIRRDSLKKIMSFSIYQFLFNIINYFSRNLDKLLIGKYISLSQLGYYEKSYRLMMLPLQNITFVINPVMLPVFAELQDNFKELGRKYISVLNILSYIAFPIGVLLYFCASELILLIFGSQWEMSILPFKILTFTVALQILASTAGSIYQAASATKQLFVSGCWGAGFMVSSFVISITFWGTIEAVCYGYLIAQIANTIQCFGLLFTTIGLPIKKLKILIRPFLLGVILFVCLWCIDLFFDIHSIIGSLIFKLVCGGMITLLLVQLISPYNLLLLVKRGTNFKSLISKV